MKKSVFVIMLPAIIEHPPILVLRGRMYSFLRYLVLERKKCGQVSRNPIVFAWLRRNRITKARPMHDLHPVFYHGYSSRCTHAGVEPLRGRYPAAVCSQCRVWPNVFPIRNINSLPWHCSEGNLLDAGDPVRLGGTARTVRYAIRYIAVIVQHK